jgi:DNA polymerase III delta prime subunit
MNIIDFSATKRREPVKHHAALPNSVRAIIIGPSGSGKTQLLLNLIMRFMKWDKLYLIAPSVDDQRCYEVLKDFNENENASEIKGENIIEFITDIDDAPSVGDLDADINNVVAYDDVMLDNKKNPARIFSRGRNKNTDVIYVTQRYTQIPKVIRDNCNIIAVFNGVDTHTLRNIWQTWCSDMEFKGFKNFFSHAQSVPHGFVTINLHDPRSRNRIGLDQIFG